MEIDEDEREAFGLRFDGGDRGVAVTYLVDRVSEAFDHGPGKKRVDLIVLGEEDVDGRRRPVGPFATAGRCVGRIGVKSFRGDHDLAGDAKER